MYCKNCGSVVDGFDFCPQCGTPVDMQFSNGNYQQPNNYSQNNAPYGQSEPEYQQNYAQYNQPADTGFQNSSWFIPQPSPGEYSSVLVFGILALVLSFFYGIGLIFSIIGLSKSSKFISRYGNISNQVKIGKGLSIAGLVVSIIFILALFFGMIGSCMNYN